MKVAIAMSGGVDSSIAAMLLKEDGYDIVGITINLFTDVRMEKYNIHPSKTISDAQNIADKYQFPLHVLDLSSEFFDTIVDPFCKKYLEGKTPNPCIDCNATIKFEKILPFALSLGCEKIATGHYAINSTDGSGRNFIAMNQDRTKDQSYFLYRLSQDTLKRTIFPLSLHSKEEVRQLAMDNNLDVHDKPDSQEICFIPDDNYVGFIETISEKVPPGGDIVDLDGKVIGKHKGIHRYTIGQRRGLGIAAPEPLYVLSIDHENNRIVAGYKNHLETKGLIVAKIVHMKETELNFPDIWLKTRSTQKPVRASVVERDNTLHILFKEPMNGVSPGQSAVIYNDEFEILGGGYILEGIK